MKGWKVGDIERTRQLRPGWSCSHSQVHMQELSAVTAEKIRNATKISNRQVGTAAHHEDGCRRGLEWFKQSGGTRESTEVQLCFGTTNQSPELAAIKEYNVTLRWLICFLGLIIAMWAYGTRQALRRALSFLLSASDRCSQTVFSTGFHVIPLWTAKLTSLCIIENYRTKKTMKGVCFYWLWVGDEGSCKWRGGGRQLLPQSCRRRLRGNSAESEHADCQEAIRKIKAVALQQLPVSLHISWELRGKIRCKSFIVQWLDQSIPTHICQRPITDN